MYIYYRGLDILIYKINGDYRFFQYSYTFT